MCVQSWSQNHSCTISSHYRLTKRYNLSRGQCVSFWKQKQTPWPQKLPSWAPPLIRHLSQNRGCEYQLCFASLRTSLNSTFSGSPAFNESFAPVFLYQDSRKVRRPRAIQLDNDTANTHNYYFSVVQLKTIIGRAQHPLLLSVLCLLCYCLCPIDGTWSYTVDP